MHRVVTRSDSLECSSTLGKIHGNVWTKSVRNSTLFGVHIESSIYVEDCVVGYKNTLQHLHRYIVLTLLIHSSRRSSSSVRFFILSSSSLEAFNSAAIFCIRVMARRFICLSRKEWVKNKWESKARRQEKKNIIPVIHPNDAAMV